MKSAWLQIIAPLLILTCFPLVSLAQSSQKPIIVRRARSARVRDTKLEAAIHSALGQNLEDEISYYYNKIDLNGDGRLDALAYVFGKSMCGTSGCDLLIFQSVNDTYRLVSDIGLAWNPIIVSQHKTHGWNDLILFVVGGGIQPGYYAMLRFDGNKYPENPTVEPAAPLKTRVKGTAYALGSRAPNSGFALRSR